jgi:hypothetical protein
MGSPIEIRQMMAEGKFSIAQFRIEASLKTALGEERRELLRLLLELFKLEAKNLPLPLLLEASTTAFAESKEVFRELATLMEANHPLKKLLDFKLLLIKDFEERGKLQEMLLAISDFQISCVENRIPFIEPRIVELSKKYFRYEFPLTLQRITLALMQKNTKLVTQEILELLLQINEARSRNASQKIQALLDILVNFELQGSEILYRNYCHLRLKGVSDKRDYKLLLELLIGIEDFRMLVLIFDLAQESLPRDSLLSFASLLRSLRDFDYIYLEKNFPELKSYFITASGDASSTAPSKEVLISEKDLELEGDDLLHNSTRSDLTPPMEEEELNLLKQVQYGDFNFNALCDLTVSFLQSDYLRAARAAILKAGELANTEEERMRALYLRVTTLMKLQDYRAALDTCLRAMDHVYSEADLLSLMYVQAECHDKLHAKSEAKKILERIIEIDEEYRLAKERLDKLNEA